MSKVPVSRYHDIEPFGVGGVEELAVAERRPPELKSSRNLESGRERLSKRNRCALVEKNSHLGRDHRTPGGVVKHAANLIQSHPREPFHEFTHLDTIFQILE